GAVADPGDAVADPSGAIHGAGRVTTGSTARRTGSPGPLGAAEPVSVRAAGVAAGVVRSEEAVLAGVVPVAPAAGLPPDATRATAARVSPVGPGALIGAG